MSFELKVPPNSPPTLSAQLHWETILTSILTALVVLVSVFALLVYPVVVRLRRRRMTNHPDGIEYIAGPEDRIFDIVAVHGLGANPEFTWTAPAPVLAESRNDAHVKPKRIDLLRDLLPHDFPEARILRFSSNLDWLGGGPVKTAQQVGRKLLDCLIDCRSNKPSVPIVFIGHSFGGIIIKEGLCLGGVSGEFERDIVDSTEGIIYLGTPHQGSGISRVGAVYASLTRYLGSETSLLLSLRSHDKHLADLEDRFVKCMHDRESRRSRTKLVSFYETKPTYWLGWLSLGLVVTRDSARGVATAVGIDTDHSGLNKCRGPEDPVYKKLRNTLMEMRPNTRPRLNPDQQYVVNKLPTVDSAEFDSRANHANEVTSCYKGTRVSLLGEIDEWVGNSDDPHMYWLHGKAGTGKSTVAYTVASNFADSGYLGASFFFRRGETDRSNTGRFSTTIATQLVCRLAPMAKYVRNAMEAEPKIAGKSMALQFEKLILEPLKEEEERHHHDSNSVAKPFIVVIDALDECENERDARETINLLSRIKHSKSIRLKIFVTSRPETPIRLGFANIPGMYTDQPLEEIPKNVVKQDISLFLRGRFSQIWAEASASGCGLPETQPSEDDFKRLVEMASPLFIFAATACRFIKNRRNGGGGPNGRLKILLKSQTGGKLGLVYLPILEQMVDGLEQSDRDRAICEFKTIFGAIISLENPLTTRALAHLLAVDENIVAERLDGLHSVLVIPDDPDSPIRLYHQSFRDFLIGTESNDFQIDDQVAHEQLARSCLKLLSDNLKEDLCELNNPSALFEDVKEQVDTLISPELQYACLHWTHHWTLGVGKAKNDDSAFTFLTTYFLNWLEALSLLGKVTAGIKAIEDLQKLVDPENDVEAAAFLYDARRFILWSRFMIETTPLQVYYSALVFAPERSIIRKTFSDRSGKHGRVLKPQLDWSRCVQSLQGHESLIVCVKLSTDNQLLFSGSRDGVVKTWDATNGECLMTIHTSVKAKNLDLSSNGRGILVPEDSSLAFIMWDSECGLKWINYKAAQFRATISPDGSWAALFCDGTIHILDLDEIWAATPLHDGKIHISDLQCHAQGFGKFCIELPYKCYRNPLSPPVYYSKTSSDTGVDPMPASVEGKHPAFWQTEMSSDTGDDDLMPAFWQNEMSTGTGDDDPILVTSVEGKHLAFWQKNAVQIWDRMTNELAKTFTENNDIQRVAFSSDGGVIVLTTCSRQLIVKDLRTGECLHRTEGFYKALKISTNGRWVVYETAGGRLKIWDLEEGNAPKSIGIHSGCSTLAISSDGRSVASGSADGTIKIWDTTHTSGDGTEGGADAYHMMEVSVVNMSADGKLAVSADRDGIMKIWSTADGRCLKTVKEIEFEKINAIAISADGKCICFQNMRHYWISIWRIVGVKIESRNKFHHDWVNLHSLAISSDGQLVAASSRNGDVQVWSTDTGERLRKSSTATKPISVSVLERLRKSSTATKPVSVTLLERLRKSRTATELVSVAFCADSHRLVTKPGYKQDEAPKIWDLALGLANGEPVLVEDVSLFYGVSDDECWITRNGRPVLWLPPEYRHSDGPNSWSTQGHKICIGCKSGRVFFYDFSSLES